MLPLRCLVQTFFLIFYLGVASLSAEQYHCTVNLDQGLQLKDMVTFKPLKNNIVTEFKAVADNGMSSKEIEYILGIHNGDPLTQEGLIQGLERLQQKNVFSKIEFAFDEQEHGVSVSLQAQAFWIIRSIKVEGISLGKEVIAQSYQLRIGERFIAKKHEISLKEICNDLYKKGYWDAQAHAFFKYDSTKKIVDITLVIKKGRLYFIDTVLISIQSDQNDEEKKQLETFIYKRIVRYLLYKPYAQNFVNTKLKALQIAIVKEGFVYVKVDSQLAKNHTKKTVTLTLSIHLEHAKKTVFVGNQFIPSSTLLDNVVQCGNAIGVVPPILLAEEISNLYRSKGFWFTTVQTEENEKYHYFVINEGKRVKIRNVRIEGAHAFSERMLTRKFFGRIARTYLDKKKIEMALRGCLDWYKQHGFWDVECLKKEYIPVVKDALYDFVCIIEEGKQRIIKDVVVKGIDWFVPVDLFLIRKDIIPLSGILLQEQKKYLEKECKKRGFIHAQVTYTFEEIENQYRVVWQVDQGKKMVFGKTIFKGSSVVDFKKILSMTPYKEGDIWSKDALQALFLKLHDLEIYKTVGIQQHFLQSHQDVCDVVVVVEDDDPCELKLRFGYQQVSRNFELRKGSSYKIGGAFMYKNPTNRADKFVIDAEITRFERRFSSAYHQPVIINLPMNLVIKGYSNMYMNPVSIGSRRVLYEALQEGVLIGLASKSEHVDIGASAGFEWSKISDISEELAALIYFVPQLVNERVPYWFFEPTFYLNYLDNNVDPHSGSYLLTSFKSLISFDVRVSSSFKLLVEYGIYGNYRSIVGAARIKLGHILLQDFPTIMPPYRFYLGGSNSLRAYQPDKCPPLATYVDDDDQRQWVPQGGKSMMNMNLEARFPLPLAHLNGAVFQDVGMLSSNLEDFFHKRSAPLAATGFGIRYVTPLGPLRFDIGWKWHRDFEEDPGYAWFLTFGYAF